MLAGDRLGDGRQRLVDFARVLEAVLAAPAPARRCPCIRGSGSCPAAAAVRPPCRPAFPYSVRPASASVPAAGAALTLGGDRRRSASLASSAARRRARSERSPSASACKRQAMRLTSQARLAALVCFAEDFGIAFLQFLDGQPLERGQFFPDVQRHIFPPSRSPKPLTTVSTEPRFIGNLKAIRSGILCFSQASCRRQGRAGTQAQNAGRQDAGDLTTPLLGSWKVRIVVVLPIHASLFVIPYALLVPDSACVDKSLSQQCVAFMEALPLRLGRCLYE